MKITFKRICFVSLIIFLAMMISACSSSKEDAVSDGKISIVTTLYPLYDFAQKIGGEHVHVSELIPFGVDPHDWTPKLRDITNITKSDLFIYNGAGFEVWIDSILESVEMDGLIVEASKGIPLIEAGNHDHDEHGHEDDHDDEHEHGNDAHDDHGHEHRHGAYDPHVWTSPKQAMKLAGNIYEALIQLDSEHRTDYEANYAALIDKLEALDEQFAQVVETSSRNEIVVAHESFAYLARDYHFKQVAVMGLSPQAEPTVKDLQKISSFIREHDIQYILFDELVSPKLAETLAEDLGIDTLVMNPLEGLTEQQLADGEDYFSIMEKNIETLRLALSK